MKQTKTNSRFAQRSKQRKVNRILNTLITFVFALILFFGWKLFFSNEHRVEKTATEEKATVEQMTKNEDEFEIGQKQEDEQEDEEEDEEAEEQEVEEITIDDPNSNVIREIVNPSWEPIGTTQTEPHVTTFDENSVDWKEMIDAISYATGIPSSDMIVWFIGNNGPNKAVATISTKDQSEHYKVFIEWVTEQGWKPTKVQQLRNRE
ncbi:YrrS family protein [Thermolongibacillus altinsuensis]